MSPEAQNAAIAKAYGWTDVAERWDKKEWLINGLHPNHGPHSNRHIIPNYLSDLNPMHEAEKILKWDDYLAFSNILTKLTEDDTCSTVFNRPLSATAAQRAEAFLKTLGLWDDSK